LDPEHRFHTDERALLYGGRPDLAVREHDGEWLARLLDAAIDGFSADRGFVVVREGSNFRAAGPF
jgi:hypothetical protein